MKILSNLALMRGIIILRNQSSYLDKIMSAAVAHYIILAPPSQSNQKYTKYIICLRVTNK